MSIKINAEYRSAKFEDGWRKTWHTILFGKFTDSPYDGLFFYDQTNGTGEFYSTNPAGYIALVSSHTGWRTSWHQIVPGYFGSSRFTGLLFYDRTAGEAEFYSTDGQGNISLLASDSGWRTSWDSILPIDSSQAYTGLLFYDRAAGHGEFYSTDGNGNLALQRSHTNWRKTWRAIIPVRIANKTYLLFYERNTGYAELYALGASGDIQLKRAYSGWRSNWAIIQSVNLRSEKYAGLIFYDRVAGEAELYTLDPSGNLAQVEHSSGWRKSWALMTKGSFGGVFDDLLLYDRDAGESEVFTLDPWPLAQLEGYVSSESILPGEPLNVHVRSTVGPFRIQLLRRGLSDTVVSNVGIFGDVLVDLPFDGPENGCNWPAATSFTVPAGSPSGLYILRLSTLDGGVTAEVPFIVRAETPGVRTKILFAMPTSTYEAYNWWGGRSLYGHGLMGGGFSWAPPSAFRVSSRRPYLGPDDFVKPKFQYWEVPFVRWLERNAIVVDYCTSFDLHARPELLAQYQLVVTVGHDEYWSWEMRDNIEGFVARGGTAVVLSGNSVWWQIRFEDGDAITCYKSADDDPASQNPALQSRTTVNWYEPMLNRPETFMTGVSFKYGAYLFGDGVNDAPVFEVVSQHPILQNTNLQIGDTFGKYRDNVGARPTWKDGWLTVFGYETDARPTPSPESPLPDYLDWRPDVDRIIAADLEISIMPQVLFYDRKVGEGELHRIDATGKLTARKFHEGWRTTWENIIAGKFGQTGYAALLFYDRSAGVGEFYAIQADGGISLLGTYDDWRRSWHQIVPGNFGGNGYSDLLFYDREAGQGEFYTTDGSGNIALLQTQDGWRQSWDLIVPGNFGGNNYTDLLFYDRSAGVGEFYATDGNGGISVLQSHSGWRGSWDQILPLGLGTGHTALLFYDRDAGTGEFYATDGVGGISLLKTHFNWRTTWKTIVPLRLDNSNRTYLLFYEQETGYAELYFADAQGNISFVRSYGDRSFMLIARSVFGIENVTREYASLGFLRIGQGRVFTASTTDWSFGLSQRTNRWSVIDQITANLLYLYGDAPQLIHPLTPPEPVIEPAPPMARRESYIGPRRGKERGET